MATENYVFHSINWQRLSEQVSLKKQSIAISTELIQQFTYTVCGRSKN